jgi:hypothetical protein
MNTLDKFVRVFDLETHDISTIPVAELAPGMVETRIRGKEGKFWIDPTKFTEIESTPFRHPRFDKATRGDIRRIMARLAEVYPLTFKKWEDGFRKDTHPNREIQAWLHLSQIYADLVRAHRLPAPLRTELFRVLLSCQTSSFEHVWQVIGLDALPREVADEAVEAYYGQPTLKLAFAAIRAEDYTDEDGHVPWPVTCLENLEARDALKQVAIIFGVDCHTRAESLFYGVERLRQIVTSGVAQNVSIVRILYDARTDQSEFLVAVVKTIKGSCCYGQR